VTIPAKTGYLTLRNGVISGYLSLYMSTVDIALMHCMDAYLLNGFIDVII